MNNAIIDRNRRAVYHALSGVFTDHATLLRALDIWDRQFADQRGFRVNLYVTAVAQDIVLNDVQVRALASSLYAAMTTSERSLPQLPGTLRTRYAEAQSTPTQSATDVSMRTGILNPRLAVFTSLLAGLIEGVVRAQKFDDFLEALEAQAPALPTSVMQARTVWINGGLTKLRQFVNVVSDMDRRAVVNDLYIALCDACGPVNADRILAHAVHAAEQIPEARFHSPRVFL
jgi:hypothetical protein